MKIGTQTASEEDVHFAFEKLLATDDPMRQFCLLSAPTRHGGSVPLHRRSLPATKVAVGKVQTKLGEMYF